MSVLPFVEAAECSAVQLIMETVIYGGVLFYSAGMIGDGSELLLLIPSLAGIVGSVVLPVLGAVPDGMMVLFSGIGPRQEAQTQLNVGMGALAGSSIMLLTIPWFLASYAGRVNLKDGVPTYSARPKLDPPNNSDMYGTGIGVDKKIKENAIWMVVTAIGFFIMQVPISLHGAFPPHATFDEMAAPASAPALYGLIVSVLLFFGYLAFQIWDAQQEAKEDEKQISSHYKMNQVAIENIRSGEITIRGVLYNLFDTKDALLDITDAEKKRVGAILKPFYKYYDKDGDGSIGASELSGLLCDLGERLTAKENLAVLAAADVDHNGLIDYEEFVMMAIRLCKGEFSDTANVRFKTRTFDSTVVLADTIKAPEEGNDEDDEDEEDDEMPEDLADLPPAEQQKRVLFRSCWMMGMGTILVLVFSDPAVDVLNEIGVRLNINAFYVSFVLAPLASNASELVAAMNYGAKKTRSMMTISLSTLEGAACMNNTFCLGIFFALIYFQELQWTFTAETLSIILIEFLMFAVAVQAVQPLWMSYVVLSFYPISLIFVWALQNLFGIK